MQWYSTNPTVSRFVAQGSSLSLGSPGSLTLAYFHFRALIRQLEQTFFDDEQVVALQIVDEMHAILCYQESSDRASDIPSALFESLSSTCDNNLLALCPAMIVVSNLWLALIAHRRTPVDIVSSEFRRLVSRALQVLKDNYLSCPSDAGMEVTPPAPVVAKAAKRLSDKQSQKNRAKKNGSTSRKAKAGPRGNTSFQAKKPLLSPAPACSPKAPRRSRSELTERSLQTLCNDVPSFDAVIGMPSASQLERR